MNILIFGDYVNGVMLKFDMRGNPRSLSPSMDDFPRMPERPDGTQHIGI